MENVIWPPSSNVTAKVNAIIEWLKPATLVYTVVDTKHNVINSTTYWESSVLLDSIRIYINICICGMKYIYQLHGVSKIKIIMVKSYRMLYLGCIHVVVCWKILVAHRINAMCTYTLKLAK